MFTLRSCGIAGLILALSVITCVSGHASEAGKPKNEESGGAATGIEDILVGSGRTPVLVRTKKGTALLFWRTPGGDLFPHDIVVARSKDDGRTWGKRIVVTREGALTKGRSAKTRLRSAQPAVVADTKTGNIYLFYTRGMDVFHDADDPRCLRFTWSEDDGKTWSKPVDPMADKRFTGLPTRVSAVISHGLQLQSGRLLVLCSVVARNRKFHHPFCMYSDDHGKTWQAGKTVPGSEALEMTMAELADGPVYLNMRNRRVYQGGAVASRQTALSKDGGISWSQAVTDKDLLGPLACNSVIRLTRRGPHDKNRLLYSGPVKGATANRQDMTIRISYDEGKTWKKEHRKLLWKGKASYSDMIVFPDLTVGIAYETAKPKWQSIRFARFTLEWLTDGKDKIAVK